MAPEAIGVAAIGGLIGGFTSNVVITLCALWVRKERVKRYEASGSLPMGLAETLRGEWSRRPVETEGFMEESLQEEDVEVRHPSYRGRS